MNAMHAPHDIVAPHARLRRTALALCLALTSLGAMAPRAAAQERTVDLSPSFERGQTWRFRYRIDSEMDFVIGQQKHAMSLTKEVVVRTKVVETGDSGAQIELVHEEVRLDARGQVPGSFDSTKPANQDADDVYARILRPLAGAALTLELAKDGEIRRVRGLDAIRPSGLVEAQLFQALFGEDEVIRMYQPLFSIKRGDPKAEPGESWDVTQRRASGLGIVESALRLTLERAGRHDARIRIDGTESVEVAPGAPGSVSASSVKGSCVWDVREGVLREMRTESTTTFAPDTEPTGGTSVAGTARATTKLERLDSAGR